jgi:hypothetical protein
MALEDTLVSGGLLILRASSEFFFLKQAGELYPHIKERKQGE